MGVQAEWKLMFLEDYVISCAYYKNSSGFKATMEEGTIFYVKPDKEKSKLGCQGSGSNCLHRHSNLDLCKGYHKVCMESNPTKTCYWHLKLLYYSWEHECWLEPPWRKVLLRQAGENLRVAQARYRSIMQQGLSDWHKVTPLLWFQYRKNVKEVSHNAGIKGPCRRILGICHRE